MDRLKRKKNKVIAYRNLPAKLPWGLTFGLWFLLDKFKADGWLWGVVITLLSIIWLICISAKANQEETDTLNNNQ